MYTVEGEREEGRYVIESCTQVCKVCAWRMREREMQGKRRKEIRC